MTRTWSAILLTLALGGCGSPTEWSEDLVIESRATESAADSATVEGATGGIVVQGVYRAPSSGYTLRAYYHLSGREVVLNVGGYPPTDVSLPAFTGKGYRISIPLDAGSYRVRVTHHDQGTGEANSRQVTVADATAGRT